MEALERVSFESQSRSLTLQEIFSLLGEKGHLILILFLSVPFLQPMPLVGLSTPLGLLIVIVGYYFLIEKPPWLPKKFAHLTVPQEVLRKTIELILKIWKFLEKILSPRWPRLHDSHFFRVINFGLMAISAMLLALPLPVPFTNTVPTVAIVLNVIGQLEEDGVVIFVSFLSFLFSIAFFTSLGLSVFFGVNHVFNL